MSHWGLGWLCAGLSTVSAMICRCCHFNLAILARLSFTVNFLWFLAARAFSDKNPGHRYNYGHTCNCSGRYKIDPVDCSRRNRHPDEPRGDSISTAIKINTIRIASCIKISLVRLDLRSSSAHNARLWGGLVAAQRRKGRPSPEGVTTAVCYVM